MPTKWLMAMGASTAPTGSSKRAKCCAPSSVTKPAVNEATRELGGTLGVAVIGSVALSVYREGLSDAPLPAQLTELARTTFVDGFSTGCVVASAVTAAAAVLTLIYLPAHPESLQAEVPQHDPTATRSPA
ncbi:hypothetical protein ACFQWH_07270 [Mycolicibacterium sp. GCM10028919]|uniref:hypothetical protein n=1 Tax=Mycolicibacterium sp. GCM10028919 TaxID=3273401 RepID=UPI003619970F